MGVAFGNLRTEGSRAIADILDFGPPSCKYAPTKRRALVCEPLTASLRKTSPRCCLNCSYSVLLRHLEMNTTWYLHSHFVWL